MDEWNNEIRKENGKIIRKFRESMGYSQKKFADEMNLDVKVIEEMEKGINEEYCNRQYYCLWLNIIDYAFGTDEYIYIGKEDDDGRITITKEKVSEQPKIGFKLKRELKIHEKDQ